MFAENYPYMPFTREMRRRYAAGDIGEVRYAEAEYLDEPADLAAMVNDRARSAPRTPRLPHPFSGPVAPSPAPGLCRSAASWRPPVGLEALSGPARVGDGRRCWSCLDNGAVFKSLQASWRPANRPGSESTATVG